MSEPAYDLIVVGAGSGGFAAARTARDLGANVALVDKGPLGGLCILRGCMPSKALLATSDALADAREAKGLGVHVGSIRIDEPYVLERKRALVKEFADYRIDGISRFPLYRGEARFLSPTRLQAGEDVITAPKFIINTGSIVAPPAIPGLAQAGYLTSDEVLELAHTPKSVVVLGGGYVGCELGQHLARMGAKTTMVIRADHLLSGEDHDIGHALTQYFREDGIDVVTGARLLRVERRDGKKFVYVVVDGVEGAIEADEIFYALGRVPNVEGFDFEKAGVAYHAIKGIEVDDTLRTSNPNIFAVGDVTGLYQLVHVAIYQGEIAARNAIGGGDERAVYDLVKTHTIFTDPQIAVVGETERALQNNGIPYVAGTYDFAEHGKAECLNKTKGFVKMLASAPDGRIIGASIIGPQAAELIHEVIVAMNYRATVHEFMRIPHLHPTLAEIWTYPAEDCAAKLDAAAAQARASWAGVG